MVDPALELEIIRLRTDWREPRGAATALPPNAYKPFGTCQRACIRR
jgi:hypothetical protein